MKAAFYDRLGPARDVLQLGEMPDPLPGAGEVRVQIQWSGVNPSDVKSRLGLRVGTMPFPRVIPHSDGMGVIDAVGDDSLFTPGMSASGPGTPPGADRTAPRAS